MQDFFTEGDALMGRWLMTAAVLAAGTVFGTMILGGCVEKPSVMTAEEVSSLFGADFTVSADITFEKLRLTADLTRQGDRTAVVITSPEHLEGLSFDGSTVRYKDLEVDTALPAASLGTVLDDVFDLLGQPEDLKITAEGEGKTLVTDTDRRFSLTVEEKPLLLEMPEAGLLAKFRDFMPAEPGGTPLPEE